MGTKRRLSNQSGQVVIEYVLLLIVLISIALVIANGLIGHEDQPGVVIKTWNGILKTIGKDIPDRLE